MIRSDVKVAGFDAFSERCFNEYTVLWDQVRTRITDMITDNGWWLAILILHLMEFGLVSGPGLDLELWGLGQLDCIYRQRRRKATTCGLYIVTWRWMYKLMLILLFILGCTPWSLFVS